MALEGALKDFGPADILQLLSIQRKTGILTLEGRMDRIRLLFHEGNIVSAESKRRGEANRLGKVLVKKGLIKEEELQTALEEQRATGAKVGNILIKKGIVERRQIQEILTSQITETVVHLFAWKEGTYEFVPHGVPVDKDMPIAIDTQHLLMDVLRIIDEWSLIEGRLTLDSVFQKTGKSEVELTAEEEEVLGFVDGENDVSTIIDLSALDDFQVSKALVSLTEKGVIEPKEALPIVSEVAISPDRGRGLLQYVPTIRFFPAITFLMAFLVSLIPLCTQKNKGLDNFKVSEDIDGIRFRIEAYKYENGYYPPSLAHLKKASASGRDRWGKPYIYRTQGDNFVLFSTGPDGEGGTEDDIY